MVPAKSARPLHAVFLERVIKIEAVQAYRPAVTDDHTAQFFEEGRCPGAFGNFEWSLYRPEDFPWGPLGPAESEKPAPISLPMQHAWNAAVAAFAEFIAALVNGELIASGVYSASGVRCEIEPVEWMRTGLILDVRNGDLVEVGQGKRTVRWSAITLLAKQPRQKKTRGHGHDWGGAWAYALTLRADDQWDWKKYRRDEKQPLPAVHKVVEDKIKDWFEAKGNIPKGNVPKGNVPKDDVPKGDVPHISDIRRNIVVPLYAGRRTRGKRKR